MSLPDAVKSVLSQYASFSGRARRSEYWFWALSFLILEIVLLIPLGIVMAQSVDPETMTYGAGASVAYGIFSLVMLALVLPTLAVTVRRLHDQDKSGFFWFMGLIPVAGPIIMLVFMASDGTPGPNRFGPSPKAVDAPAVVVSARARRMVGSRRLVRRAQPLTAPASMPRTK